MNVQIVRISLFQTAKVIAALYFVVTCIAVALYGVALLVSPALRGQTSLVAVVVSPLLYALFAFVFTFIAAWLYNQVAKVVGGIEYTTAEARRDF